MRQSECHRGWPHGRDGGGAWRLAVGGWTARGLDPFVHNCRLAFSAFRAIVWLFQRYLLKKPDANALFAGDDGMGVDLRLRKPDKAPK
jgi:hypothetical protein